MLGGFPRPPSSQGRDPSGPRMSRGSPGLPRTDPALRLPWTKGTSREPVWSRGLPPCKAQGLSRELESLLTGDSKFPTSQQEGTCKSDLGFENEPNTFVLLYYRVKLIRTNGITCYSFKKEQNGQPRTHHPHSKLHILTYLLYLFLSPSC